jgi:hypothetical protein
MRTWQATLVIANAILALVAGRSIHGANRMKGLLIDRLCTNRQLAAL